MCSLLFLLFDMFILFLLEVLRMEAPTWILVTFASSTWFILVRHHTADTPTITLPRRATAA